MNENKTFPDFEELPHQADAALVVYGRSLPELFSHAARGMYHILGIKGKDYQKVEEVIVLKSADLESLLVSFLTELLYMAEKGQIMAIIELSIEKGGLKAKVNLSPVLGMAREIKAVTFNEMKILYLDGAYQTRIVFDL